MKNLIAIILISAGFISHAAAQTADPAGNESEKIDQIITLAINKLGGDNYINAKTIASTGKLSILKDGKIDSFQSFTDVLIFPDKERTDFSQRGAVTVQVNMGDTGWIYDEIFEVFGPQTDKQIEDFGRGLKTHYDFLLRGFWKETATLSDRGRRSSGVGRSNNVLKLEFEDGFWVEYEFADSGYPMKTVYPSKNVEDIEILEENRYAQYILTGGIYFPFILDHFVDGKRSYRANYIDVRFNRQFPASIFEKPSNPKKIKKLKV